MFRFYLGKKDLFDQKSIQITAAAAADAAAVNIAMYVRHMTSKRIYVVIRNKL